MLAREPAPQPITAAEADLLFAGLSGMKPLLAVSGGPDSVAMMGLCIEWARRAGAPQPRVAAVDHGLRPESAAEAAGVAATATRLGLEAHVLAWGGPKPTTGVQEAARAARYALLAAHARAIGADALVTAHTLDDQAETVLMRLAGGSGVAGLGAMAPRSVTLGLAHLRPLLDVPKARLVATCRRLGLPFVEDAGNLSPRFARGRWRAARSLLEAEGLRPERLATLARRAREADAAIQAAAAAALSEAARGEALDMRRLAGQPQAVVVAALARWLDGRDADAAPMRLERLEACAAALADAAARGERHVRTLAGAVLTLGRDGLLIRRREARRRGIVNPVGAPVLGNGRGRP